MSSRLHRNIASIALSDPLAPCFSLALALGDRPHPGPRGGRAGGERRRLWRRAGERPGYHVSRAEQLLMFSEFLPESPQRPIWFAMSGNLVLRRETYERFGPFVEVRASEDILYSGRVASQGGRILFFAPVRVARQPATAAAISPQPGPSGPIHGDGPAHGALRGLLVTRTLPGAAAAEPAGEGREDRVAAAAVGASRVGNAAARGAARAPRRPRARRGPGTRRVPSLPDFPDHQSRSTDYDLWAACARR